MVCMFLCHPFIYVYVCLTCMYVCMFGMYELMSDMYVWHLHAMYMFPSSNGSAVVPTTCKSFYCTPQFGASFVVVVALFLVVFEIGVYDVLVLGRLVHVCGFYICALMLNYLSWYFAFVL